MDRRLLFRIVAASLLILPAASMAVGAEDGSSGNGPPAINSARVEVGRAELAGKDITPQAGEGWWLNLSVEFSDPDGGHDLTKMEALLFSQAGPATPRCGWTTRGGGGRSVEYALPHANVQVEGQTALATFSFWMAPDDETDRYAWVVKVEDGEGEEATRCEDGYRIIGVVGIRTDLSSIAFTALDPGAAETASTPVRVVVENVGTVPVRVRYAASALASSGGGSIAAGNLFLATVADLSDRQAFPADGGEAEAPPTIAPGATREFFLALKVPVGTGAGAYTGTVTFAGVSA